MRTNVSRSAVMMLTAVLLGSVDVVFAATAARTNERAATTAVQQFSVADGLEVSIFASEPMLRNPTDMDIDERGRVWLLEGVNYRSTFQKWGVLQPAGDRVVVLEDTNGDGQADKETVFYQDPSINAALGICVLGNKVIVSVSPNIFVLTDTDGDGKADQRELLFTGMSGVDHDHGVHAFVFGPDGKLYFNMGNEAKQLLRPVNKLLPLHGAVRSVPTTPVIDLAGNEVNAKGKPYRMGMVFRCDPDGGEVETLAWNFRNNYEVAVDSFGTLWQSDNDDDGNRGVRINYVMEFGNYGYSDEMTGAGWPTGWNKAKAKGAPEDAKVFHQWHQYDPGVVPNLLHTGAGSPTGLAVYEGRLLPEIFRNQIIHCDAGPRVVRAYPAKPEGAGYVATTTNMLTTSDTWFRPSDVCVSPDGSTYVADWNDAGVGGHNMVDQKVETMTGRVYRIAPKGTRTSVPKLDLKTAAGCVSALQSPNQATRYLAWTKLNAMQGKAEKELVKLWKSDDARMRARALQLLARIKGSEEGYVSAALKDGNPDIRIAGLRIARELKLDVIPFITLLARDPNAQVRRECAIALRHNSSAQAPVLWAELAAEYDGKDRWYLEALGIGADKQWDKFFDAWLAQTGDKWNSPAGREIVWRSRSQKTPALLARIIQDDSLSVEQHDHYFRSFDFITGSVKTAALVELVTSKRAEIGLAALSRLKSGGLDATPELRQAVSKLLEQTRGTPQFVEIVRDYGIKDQDAALLDIAIQQPSSSLGVAAMRLVLNSQGISLVENSLAGTNAIRVVEVLGNTGEKEIVAMLSPLVTDVARDVALRRQAVRSLAQVQAGASAVLKLVEEQKLPADLTLDASTTLNAVRWDDLKARAAQLLPLPQGREAQPLPPVSELVKLTGDSVKGAVVFRSDAVGCIKCHQVNGEGTDFGPNVSEIGTKLGKDALYESILDPSAGISFGYEAWQITLKNGDEAFGLRVSETPDEIAIKAAGGIVTRYKKSDIATLTQQKLSIMPAGLQQTMTQQEFVDLVEYLASLKKAKQ